MYDVLSIFVKDKVCKFVILLMIRHPFFKVCCISYAGRKNVPHKSMLFYGQEKK